MLQSWRPVVARMALLGLGLAAGCGHPSPPAPPVNSPATPTSRPATAPARVYPAGGHLTQAQAIQTASDFCKAIGAPASAPGTAAFSTGSPGPFLPPTYWLPCWRVRFGSAAEVEVADSGVICKYYNFALSQQAEQDRRPAGPAIRRADALAKAAAALAAAHVTKPLAPPEAQEANITFPPQRAGHLWTVIRRRQAQGVPFQDQQATVILQAETGAVQGLGVTFPTPPPAAVTPVVTPRQAVAAAQSALGAQPQGGTGFRPAGTAQLMWVTPQTHPAPPRVNGVLSRPPAPVPASDLPARLAWLCPFRAADGTSALLPVDAVTGKVLSDNAAFDYPPLRPRPAPHAAALPVSAAPPPTVLRGPVVATTLPGATKEPASAPGVPRYRLTLDDIYAPIAALTALGYNCAEPGLGGNEETDQAIGQKLEQAARSGGMQLVPGPSAIVPDGDVWGLTRTRPTVCHDPLYWKPRPVPATIAMTFSVTPEKQPDGKIRYRYEQGVKALAAGETLPPGAFPDSEGSGWSWGDAGATTLLCGLEEERYTWPSGAPGHFRTDGVMHLILIRSETL